MDKDNYNVHINNDKPNLLDIAKIKEYYEGEITRLNHNIEVLKGNRITEDKMKSAIAQFEYIDEKFYQLGETSNTTYELWLTCRDYLKTMMENSGYYKLSIFSHDSDCEITTNWE